MASGKIPGTTGPDYEDVLAMMGMVRRDLGLRTTVQASPRMYQGDVNGLLLVLRVEPLADVGTPWKRWKPLDFHREWSPRGGRRYPAEVWFLLFDLYSYEFPSDWPTWETLPLPLP